ncbi:hypothetical protein D9C01_12540, partial [Corynebacterium diphtheriae]
GKLAKVIGAALAAAATNNQIMAALDDIQDYLAVIDEKIDRLLKQRKLEIAGQLGGVVFAIEEAESVQESTGHVSAVTWSKVQQNSLILQQVLARGRVPSSPPWPTRVIAAKSDVGKLAKVIGAALAAAATNNQIMAALDDIQDYLAV